MALHYLFYDFSFRKKSAKNRVEVHAFFDKYFSDKNLITQIVILLILDFYNLH